jgi:spectinomycin phosphotransferase
VHQDPGLDLDQLAASLRSAYGVEATRFRFRPGYDARSAAYEVTSATGPLFVKVYLDGADLDALDVPAALAEAGVPSVPGPIRTGDGEPWAATALGAVVAMPFVHGRAAVDVGMGDEDWRAFGSTLRAVHDSGLEERFAERLRVDRFDGFAALDAVRAVDRAARHHEPAGARGFAEMLLAHRPRIEGMAQRMNDLGNRLRHRSVARVLCHADIHAANILVRDGGGIALVDWDGPMIAPRERDLLFVIGSRIARRVEPHEETWFFEGYGDVPVDQEAIVFYRYERILEDVAEFAREVLDDPATTDATRLAHTALVDGFFAPDGIVQTAESVVVSRVG